jgi:hypothetical protein
MAKNMGPSTGAFPDQGGSHKDGHKKGRAKGNEHLHPNVPHDKIAHPSHHEANADHGTPQGFDGGMEYEDGGCDHHLGDNVADED